MKRLSKETRDKIIAEVATGYTYADIASRYGVSITCVGYWALKSGLGKPRKAKPRKRAARGPLPEPVVIPIEELPENRLGLWVPLLLSVASAMLIATLIYWLISYW